jgi:paraquat-inducible protein B
LLDGNVSGLGLGTIVRFKGIKVGEVDDFVGVAADEGSEETVKLRVDLRLSPGPLGLPKNLTKETLRDALEERVENGLRARVATEGLFAQNLVLELVQLASAPAAEVSVDPDGRLLLPTAPAVLPDAGAGVSDLVKRISDLPIEELMSSATQALAGISRLTGTAEGLLATESVGRIPQTIEQTLEDVRRVVAEIREGGAVDNMNATLRSADSALKSIAAAASTLPALTKRLDVAANGLQATIAGYDSQSRFYQDVRKVLRDISSTSEALQSLARSIERNPSSLIRGRR